MYKIIIRLPSNRDYAGRLHLEAPSGKRIAGPFPVCGRADDKLAQGNKNPDRDPLLPFGDTPLGEYQVVQIITSGTGTPYVAKEFGSAGIVLLRPEDGEAVLADANGRFGFFIQGGAVSRDGALRPTEGSLRLFNGDQRKFINALRRLGDAKCQCLVEKTESENVKCKIAVEASFKPAMSALSQGKAILSGLFTETATAIQPETSRRAWLRRVLLASGISLSVPSILKFSTDSARGQDYGGHVHVEVNPDPNNILRGAASDPGSVFDGEKKSSS